MNQRVHRSAQTADSRRTSAHAATGAAAVLAMSARALASSVFALTLSFAACGPRATPEFELRSVANPARAALELEIAAEPLRVTESLEADEVRQRVRTLITTIEGAARDWTMLRGDMVKELGDAAIPYLVTTLSDFALPAAQRVAALQALSVLDTPAAAERLCIQLESSPEVWVRRYAAYEIGMTSQDQCLPRLLSHFAVESDGETLLWIAASLGSYECLAGFDTLVAGTGSSVDPTQRSAAQTEVQRLLQRFGASNADELARGWSNGNVEGRLRVRAPSARLKLDTWRRLIDDPFDDATLSLLASYPSWSVELLCAALHETEPRVRRRALAILERQGARAWSAQPALSAALERADMAVDAARCLGAIRDPRSVSILQAHLGPQHPIALRIEAARALGRLGEASVSDSLLAVAGSDAPDDLASAAWVALLELGRAQPALEPVVALVRRNPSFPRAGPTLEAWVSARASAGSELALQVLAERAEMCHLPPPPGVSAEVKQFQCLAGAIESRVSALLR